MADVKKLKINNNSYDIKDGEARSLISALTSTVTQLQSTVTDLVNNKFPIGTIIHCSDCSTQAQVIAKYGGNTWRQITDRCIIGASTTYTQGSTGGSTTTAHTHSVTASGSIANTTATGSIANTTATGSISNTTLTASQIPAHNHGLNSHKHGIPQLTGVTTTDGVHTHNSSNNTNHSFVLAGTTGVGANPGNYTGTANANQTSTTSNGSHYHGVTIDSGFYTDAATGSTANNTGGDGAHGHTFTGTAHNHTFTGTAHNHTFTGSAVTSGTASNTNNMQPYIAEYIWERLT